MISFAPGFILSGFPLVADVSGFPSGVYIAVMKDEKGDVARGKFVKR